MVGFVALRPKSTAMVIAGMTIYNVKVVHHVQERLLFLTFYLSYHILKANLCTLYIIHTHRDILTKFGVSIFQLKIYILFCARMVALSCFLYDHLP